MGVGDPRKGRWLVEQDKVPIVLVKWRPVCACCQRSLQENELTLWKKIKKQKRPFTPCRVCAWGASSTVKGVGLVGGYRPSDPHRHGAEELRVLRRGSFHFALTCGLHGGCGQSHFDSRWSWSVSGFHGDDLPDEMLENSTHRRIVYLVLQTLVSLIEVRSTEGIQQPITQSVNCAKIEILNWKCCSWLSWCHKIPKFKSM